MRHRCWAFILLSIFIPASLAGDENTRAARIEAERRQKASQIRPAQPSSYQGLVDRVRRMRLLDLFTTGIEGFRVRMGGLITGSGIALGPEYIRRDLAHDTVTFRTSARGSYRKFYLLDMQLNMPKLADDHAFVDLYTRREDYPHVDYYGPGPNSKKTGHSVYRLEETSFSIRGGVRPLTHLRLGVLGRYAIVNIGPGRHGHFVSTDRIYTPASTPGISRQSNHFQVGPFLQYDYRDAPGRPRHGGNYVVQYSTYLDRERYLYSFNRLDAEAQQYIPFFNDTHVIALRAQTSLTDPHRGQVVPFYLQPTLGGSEELRGFRPFRFHDNNSLVVTGEYRWELFAGMDMALFMDAGKVFPKWREWSLTNLETSYGLGFRFHLNRSLLLRVDTGFSHEGVQIWFKFNNVF